MKIEITDKPVEELESSSVTRGQARRSARKTRRSGTKGNTTRRSPGATRKPAAEKKVGRKPASKSPSKPKAPRAGSKPRQQKQKKAHKVPNSVELLVQKSKPKLRVKISEPGRYVLAGRGVQYALVRVKEETKYTPSMGQKLFSPKGLESNSSDGDSPDWDVIGLDEIVSESIADLELEYEMELDAYVYGEENGGGSSDIESNSARAPGARNNQAGNKLGRKKRAPNMLAPGWHMLKKGSDNKITKQYVGPRMSARRLLDIAGGGSEEKDKKPATKPANKKAAAIQKKIDAKTKQVDRIKAQMEKTDDKGKKKELAGKAREINADIRGLTRDLKKENTATKRDAKKAEKADAKPQKAKELDRKVASGFRKELNERDMKDAKVQRSTKDGSMKITIDKGDRTKLTGALARLKKQMEGKLEITREMKGDKVVVSVKMASGKEGAASQEKKAGKPAKSKPVDPKKQAQYKKKIEEQEKKIEEAVKLQEKAEKIKKDDAAAPQGRYEKNIGRAVSAKFKVMGAVKKLAQSLGKGNPKAQPRSVDEKSAQVEKLSKSNVLKKAIQDAAKKSLGIDETVTPKITSTKDGNLKIEIPDLPKRGRRGVNKTSFISRELEYNLLSDPKNAKLLSVFDFDVNGFVKGKAKNNNELVLNLADKF